MEGSTSGAALERRSQADEPAPPTEGDRREISGAIKLVASGAAVAVILCGLNSPEAAVAALAATATAAGVGLRIEHVINGNIDVVVGRP